MCVERWENVVQTSQEEEHETPRRAPEPEPEPEPEPVHHEPEPEPEPVHHDSRATFASGYYASPDRCIDPEVAYLESHASPICASTRRWPASSHARIGRMQRWTTRRRWAAPSPRSTRALGRRGRRPSRRQRLRFWWTRRRRRRSSAANLSPTRSSSTTMRRTGRTTMRRSRRLGRCSWRCRRRRLFLRAPPNRLRRFERFRRRRRRRRPGPTAHGKPPDDDRSVSRAAAAG